MNLLAPFKSVNTFIFDVDGVMTDGSVVITESGELLRTMNVKDGYAMKHAINQGYRIAIITGGNSQGVIKRLKGLGIVDIYWGQHYKMDAYEELVLTYDLKKEDILYMGDDVADVVVLKEVGLATCPNDVIPEVKAVSDYISPHVGGAGCVRDVIEKVLKLNGKW